MTKNVKTVVGIFAHPDDEAFGPAGTIAKFAQNSNTYVICATRGEAGMGPKSNLAQAREKELRKSAKILGVKGVYFLGFKDGTLSNNLYHKLASRIENRLQKLKPEILITHEPHGISGHIDHIAVSMVTTFVFKKMQFIKTLMYYCIDKKAAAKMGDYFIYFPPGYDRREVDTIVDITDVWQKKMEAMLAHESQAIDAKRILARAEGLSKEEYFLILKK